METISFYKEFVNKISKCSPSYSNEDYTINITPINLGELQNFLSLYTIEFTVIQQINLAIDIDSFPCKLFWNDDFFLKKTNKTTAFENDILILNFDSSSPCKLYCHEKTYIDFSLEDSNWFFDNSYSYLKFLDILFLENEKHNDVFHFVDDFSLANGRAIFTSSKDFGKLIIKFDQGILQLNEKENYTDKVNSFIECFSSENKHLPKFLKNEFFNFLIKEKEDKRILILFEKLSEIVASAKLNFEVYLSDLSIESLKKDYNDYKQKYFNQLSDFLNNLTNKIIALPITISAVLFGITKLTESTSSLLMIIIALIITGFYMFGIIKMYLEDLTFIEDRFKRDYKLFSKSSFFIKFPEEEDFFKKIYIRINSKLGNLKLFTNVFFWITAISNFTLIIYTLTFILPLSLSTLGVIGSLALFLICLIYQYYLNTDK